MDINTEIWQKLSVRPVASFRLRIILPKCGGYNARPFSGNLMLPEVLRASSIKGLWRWWSRVALSYATCGRLQYDVLDEKVSEILGSAKKGISLFRISVDVPDKELEKFKKLFELNKNLFQAILLSSEKLIDHLRSEGYREFYVNLMPDNLCLIVNKIQNQKKIEDIKNSILSSCSRIFRINKSLIRADIKESKGRKYIRVQLADLSGNNREIFRKFISLTVNKNQYVDDLVKHYFDYILRLVTIPRIKLAVQPHKYKEDRKLQWNRCNIDLVRAYIERLSEELTIPRSIEAKLNVYLDSEISPKAVRFFMYTLLACLLFGGVGSDKNRGFGSIQILEYEFNFEDRDLSNDLAVTLGKLRENIAKNLESFINEVMRSAREYLLELDGKLYPENMCKSTPFVPTLRWGCFDIKVIKIKAADEIEAVSKIGQACLKINWKKIMSMKHNRPGGNLHTWILGLPRAVHNTGYFISENEEIREGRRQSAIQIKLLELEENRKKEYYALVCGFLSRDWPSMKKLKHYGKHHPRGKPIRSFERSLNDEQIIKKAYRKALEKIEKILLLI